MNSEEERQAIYQEFNIYHAAISEDPEGLARMADAVIGLRRYAKWVYDTDNGRRLRLEYLVEASEHNKND